ncbi:MAG: dihydroxyacetone kinase subunit DhaL [Pseudomonadota bacterium]
MSMDLLRRAAHAAHDAIRANEDRIEGLDRAIGDGDHYHNVIRGAEVAAKLADELGDAAPDQAPDQALKQIGMKLLSTIGGASGPLMSSFFLAAAKTPGAGAVWDRATVTAMVRDGVAAIQARGKAKQGDKTMLDTLIPVAEALEAGAGDDPAALAAKVQAAAEAGMQSTKDILATKGRAAFLGERAIGHIDPGAMSCCVIVTAICQTVASGETL